MDQNKRCKNCDVWYMKIVSSIRTYIEGYCRLYPFEIKKAEDEFCSFWRKKEIK